MSDIGSIAEERMQAARFRRRRANASARPLRTDYNNCACRDNGDSCDPCAAYRLDLNAWELAQEAAADADREER